MVLINKTESILKHIEGFFPLTVKITKEIIESADPMDDEKDNAVLALKDFFKLGPIIDTTAPFAGGFIKQIVWGTTVGRIILKNEQEIKLISKGGIDISSITEPQEVTFLLR